MKNRISSMAAMLACSIIMPSAAFALEPLWKSSGAESTAISGYNGELEILELDTSDGLAVTGLTSQEAGNRPCNLIVYSAPLDANSDVHADPMQTSRCSWTSSSLRVFFLDNPRYFVRGISVCSSKTGNERRMKGFKIVAAKVWQTKRELDVLATTDTDQRNNCAGDWHETVYCAENEVASGVNVYWSWDEDAIVGLGLRCRNVAWLG